MISSDLQTAMQVCQLFPGLSNEDRAAVLEQMVPRTFSAGQTIVQQGQSDQALWLIISGACNVLRRQDDQHTVQLATLTSGHVFGEMSLLRSAPHVATVVSATDVAVMQLPGGRFEQLHAHRPKLAFQLLINLVTILSDRLRRMDEWVTETLRSTPATSATHRHEWQEFRSRLFHDWQVP